MFFQLNPIPSNADNQQTALCVRLGTESGPGTQTKHQNMPFLIPDLGLGSLDTDWGTGKNKAAESEPRCPAEG